MLPSLLVFSYQIHKRSIDKIDTTEIQLMELNSFKEVANNIGEGCGNVPIVLVRCTVGDILYKSSINKSMYNYTHYPTVRHRDVDSFLNPGGWQ